MFQTIAAKVQDSLAKANQVATETFSYMKTVRSFANEDGETFSLLMHLTAAFPNPVYELSQGHLSLSDNIF